MTDERCQGRHHDGPVSQVTCLLDCFVQGHAFVNELTQERNQQNPVLNSDAKQNDKGDRCRNRESHFPEPEGDDTADQCKRQNRNDEHRIAKFAERNNQKNHDHQQHNRHHQAQALHGSLLVFELAAEREKVTGRQFLFERFEAFLQVGNETAEIAVSDVGFDNQTANAVLA